MTVFNDPPVVSIEVRCGFLALTFADKDKCMYTLWIKGSAIVSVYDWNSQTLKGTKVVTVSNDHHVVKEFPDAILQAIAASYKQMRG